MENPADSTKKPFSKGIEAKYKQLIERAYNLRQTDDSLSDILYFEAERLLKGNKVIDTANVS